MQRVAQNVTETRYIRYITTQHGHCTVYSQNIMRLMNTIKRCTLFCLFLRPNLTQLEFYLHFTRNNMYKRNYGIDISLKRTFFHTMYFIFNNNNCCSYLYETIDFT